MGGYSTLDRAITADPAASTKSITDCIEHMRRALPRKSIEGIGIALQAA